VRRHNHADRCAECNGDCPSQVDGGGHTVIIKAIGSWSARCEPHGILLSRLRRFNGTIKQTVRLSKQQEGHLMKISTIALATAFALSSTAALAQAGLSGYGSSVAPSVGSYVAPTVGSYVNNATPTWRTTGPAAPMPGPAVGNAFGSTLTPMRSPSRARLAATRPVSGLRR
jgi:hypothetical protein